MATVVDLGFAGQYIVNRFSSGRDEAGRVTPGDSRNAHPTLADLTTKLLGEIEGLRAVLWARLIRNKPPDRTQDCFLVPSEARLTPIVVGA